MERRYQARLDELLDDAEVRPGLLRGLLPRLETFLEPFVGSLCCCEQRTNAHHYVSGLLSDLASKDAESIAYLHDRERQGLQKFIGQAPWDHKPLIAELARQVGQRLGEPDGVLVFDPSAFVKQGKKSVGVAAPVVRPAGQGRELPGRRLPRLRLAHRPRPGRFPPLPAQGVDPGPQAPERGRRAQGGPLRHPARAGPGDARRAGRSAAAPLGRRRRRDGPQLLVPPAVAPAGRALPAGRAVEHPGARPGAGRPAVLRAGAAQADAVRARRRSGARRWRRTTGRRSRCATGRRGRW